MRPFAGPPLPRLEQRGALRRAAACERPHAAQRKNVSQTMRGELEANLPPVNAPAPGIVGNFFGIVLPGMVYSL